MTTEECKSNQQHFQDAELETLNPLRLAGLWFQSSVNIQAMCGRTQHKLLFLGTSPAARTLFGYGNKTSISLLMPKNGSNRF